MEMEKSIKSVYVAFSLPAMFLLVLLTVFGPWYRFKNKRLKNTEVHFWGLLMFLAAAHGVLSSWDDHYCRVFRLPDAAGGLIRPYKKDNYFWEALAFSIKLAIASIMTFAAKLGVQVQMNLSMSVMMMALMAPIIGKPYKHDNLNSLQVVSHLVNALTFFQGIFIFDQETTTDKERDFNELRRGWVERSGEGAGARPCTPRPDGLEVERGGPQNIRNEIANPTLTSIDESVEDDAAGDVRHGQSPLVSVK
ncbi:hypothetical protein BSKO_04586 [Bryopsis sp. KO-2023]|nr:hypothetical protein BSKO_04586 [Bryopsis sp. KO-2023]